MAGDRDLTIKIGTEADIRGAEAAAAAIENVTEAATEANEAFDPQIPTAPGAPNGSPEATRQSTAATNEAAEATERLTAEEKRLLEVKAQFMTAAEAQVAEVQRLVESAQRQAQAQQEAAEATDRNNDSMQASATASRTATKSIEQLQGELRSLQRQLLAAPIGGKEFLNLAARTKDVRKELSLAEEQARRLGNTVGRGGNAGMAVLEFSRAFEDAQYGIRGVLNNIPGLIAMLGGGAGLAGIISVLAVVGTQLWERMGSGADNAKSKAEAYKSQMEDLDKIIERLDKDALEQLAKGGEEAFRRLQEDLGKKDFRAKVSTSDDNLERIKIEGAAQVALAVERFKLAKTESDLSRASGEKAVRLSKEREESIKRILSIEQGVTAQLREQELSVLRRKIEAAKVKLAETEIPKTGAQADVNGIKAQLDEANKAGEEAANLRTRIIWQLQDEVADLKKTLGDLRKEFSEGGDATKFDVAPKISQAEEDIKTRQKRINELSTAPDGETDAIKKAAELSKQLEVANENLKKITDLQTSVSADLNSASQALTDAINKQEAQKTTEDGLRKVDEDQRTNQQFEDSQSREMGALGDLVNEFSANPDLAPLVQTIKAALADKALSVEELAAIPGAFRAYERQIASLGTAVLDAARGSSTRLNEIERQLRQLNASAGKRNP